MMPWFEFRIPDPKEKVEDGIENSAGFVGRKVGRRLNANHDQPENGGNPRFQGFALMGIQDGERKLEGPPHRTKRDKGGLA